MADFLPTDERTDRHDRTARIEELLLAGLDYYFAGEHERAINIWTRVLFLDRGHARARAYIERARGALAERQRVSDELIHRGIEAFDEGETATARELLATAIAREGPHDVAVALLDRLDRLEPAGAMADATPRDGAPAVLDGAPRRPSARAASWAILILSLVALGSAALYVAITVSDTGGSGAWRAAGAQAPLARPVQEPLPVPRSADLALWRATTLKNGGHLKDALAALDRVNRSDPAYGDAQRLRTEIQSLLLAGLLPSGDARDDHK